MPRRYWLLVLVLGLLLVPLVIAIVATRPDTAAGSVLRNFVTVPSTVTQNDPVSQTNSGALQAPDLVPSLQLSATSGYFWNYSAKFVCGYQATLGPSTDLGEPVFKPGNYATDINIHNYNYKSFKVYKKLIVLVDQGNIIGREPQVRGSQILTNVLMGPDTAMLDDCNALWAMAYPAAPPLNPMPLFSGYLVVLSPLDLDIDAAYTANAPGPATVNPTGISINVVRVLGKRVYVPAGILQ